MRRRIRGRELTTALLAIGGAALASCGGPLAELRARAARDFACPRAELVIDDVDAHTKRVSGCGTTAMYVEMCLEGMGCSWEPKPDPEQPSPPTATSGTLQR